MRIEDIQDRRLTLDKIRTLEASAISSSSERARLRAQHSKK